jgi:hypothetical protein
MCMHVYVHACVYVCLCVCVPPGSVAYLMRRVRGWEQKALTLTPFPVWNRGPTTSVQMSGVCLLAEQGKQIRQSFYVKEVMEPLRAQNEGGKGKPVSLRLEVVPASTWGLPTSHRGEAMSGPGKTHGLRVYQQVLMPFLSLLCHVTFWQVTGTMVSCLLTKRIKLKNSKTNYEECPHSKSPVPRRGPWPLS